MLVLDEPAWALWSVPAAAVLVGLIYIAAGIGQRLGQPGAEPGVFRPAAGDVIMVAHRGLGLAGRGLVAPVDLDGRDPVPRDRAVLEHDRAVAVRAGGEPDRGRSGRQSRDPEIPVDIYELGLIYDVFVNEAYEVKVLMTLTSPNCPVAESLPLEVEEKVKSLDVVKDAEVEITFDPPWTQELMSEEARLELGFL